MGCRVGEPLSYGHTWDHLRLFADCTSPSSLCVSWKWIEIGLAVCVSASPRLHQVYVAPHMTVEMDKRLLVSVRAGGTIGTIVRSDVARICAVRLLSNKHSLDCLKWCSHTFFFFSPPPSSSHHAQAVQQDLQDQGQAWSQDEAKPPGPQRPAAVALPVLLSPFLHSRLVLSCLVWKERSIAQRTHCHTVSRRGLREHACRCTPRHSGYLL
jgi:hypothetical protein